MELNNKKKSIKTQLVELLLLKYGNKTFTRGDILETLIEDIKGGTYHPTRDRGMYSCNLQTIKVRNYWTGSYNEGYLMRPGREKRHLTRIGKNQYKVVV